MTNDARSGARGGRSETKKWAAIERRLSGLFETSPPHVRQNLATLAAVLADEPAALEGLARIAAEATEDVAQKRGQADDVLRSVLTERNRLTPAQQTLLDDQIKEKLGEKWQLWEIGSAVDALLRLGFPVRALPVEAFAKAVIEEAGHFTLGERDQEDASIRARVGGRLRQFARAEEAADETWRRALRDALLDKFGELNRRERGTIHLTLLRVWPALIASEGGSPQVPLASPWELNTAASLGRGAAWTRIWKVAAGAATAAGLLVVLVFTTLLILGLPFESGGLVSTSIIAGGLWAFALLTLGGASLGMLVAFLYVPTAGRRLSRVMLLIQLFVPATVAGIATALFARMSTLFGFEDDDKILVPVFVMAVLALATMLRVLYGMSLRPRADLPERQDAWYIAIVAGPAILLSIELTLAVHVLGRPGAGVFALLITVVVAAASGVWSAEERNRPAEPWQGNRTGLRIYRLSKAAAIMVAGVGLATIALAFQSKSLAEGIPVTAAALKDGQVSVPAGRPFILKSRVDNPYRLAPVESLLVRQGSEWKRDIPSDLTRRLLCVDCARFPQFSDWLTMFLRTPGSRERRRMELGLIAAVRPGDEMTLPEIPTDPTSIPAGTPVRITVPPGSRYGFRLANPNVGYIVSGVDGTHFSNRRPATLIVSDKAPSEAEGADMNSAPPLFELEPGTYRTCVFLAPDDEDACLPSPHRMRKWVGFPGDVQLILTPAASVPGGP